jgi:Fe2+ or Zn2+ uptake regulation protein
MSAEEDVSTFLRTLTKPPQFKVLTALAEKPAQEFTKTEIANRSGIGRTTLYRIWEDLEKMKAITASRQVGAVTLYRLNPESPVVQSLLLIRDKLATIQGAVERIETLQHAKKSEKPQDQIPPAQSTLLKLLDMKATSSERAITEEALRLKEHERVILPSLVESGLIERNGKMYSLSSLGKMTAESAARLWGHETRESIDETISSLKVALGIVSQEIKKASRDLSADKSTHQPE